MIIYSYVSLLSCHLLFQSLNTEQDTYIANRKLGKIRFPNDLLNLTVKGKKPTPFIYMFVKLPQVLGSFLLIFQDAYLIH